MLELFRRNKKSIFGFVIIGFCALLMVPFGVDFINQQGAGDRNSAIVVDEAKISNQQYYQRLSLLQRSYGRHPGVVQRTVDELINEVLFTRLAESLGFVASHPQIERNVMESPFFGGVQPTSAMYEAFLRQAGMSGETFERMMALEVTQEQLQQLLSDLSIPTEPELRRAFEAENTKKGFKYIAFTPQAFLDKVQAEEAKLQEYYQEHAEEYETPRKVEFSFVAYRPEAMADKVELSEEDLRDAYQRDTEQYFEPRQIKLQKIVVRKRRSDPGPLEKMVTGVAEPNAPDPAKEIAEKLHERLKSGEPFADVATSASEDEATAKQGGDIGWVTYDQLEEPLRSAAARLEEGAHSGVVETPESFVLLRASEKKESKKKPFEQVRSEIEAKLRLDDAPEYASAAAYDLYERWQARQDTPLDQFAAAEGQVAVRTPKPLAAGETAPDINAQLTRKVINLNAGTREVLRVDGTAYVVEILSVAEPEVPPFEKAREQVLEGYKRRQAAELATAAAAEALASLRAAKPALGDSSAIEQLAAKHGLKVESTEAATRRRAAGALFGPPDSRRVLFALRPDNTVPDEPIEAFSATYVAQLFSSEPPPPAEFDAKKAELLQSQSTLSGAVLMDALLKTMRGRLEVWVNPELYETSTGA